MRPRAWLAASPFALLALACSGFAPGSDELAQSTDANMVASSTIDWSCLGRTAPAAAVAPVDRDHVLSYTFAALDFVTRQVPPELTARACNLADLGCASPVSPLVQPGADGKLTVPLFQGFLGYFEATAPSTLPAMLFQDRALSDTDADQPYPSLLVPPAAFASLTMAIGVTPDPETGYVGVYAFDCAGNLAPGVHVELSGGDGATAYYVVDGLPSTQVDTTGSDGIAGFLNVPPGTVVMQASLKATGQVLGTRSLGIRKGWETTADIFALP